MSSKKSRKSSSSDSSSSSSSSSDEEDNKSFKPPRKVTPEPTKKSSIGTFNPTLRKLVGAPKLTAIWQSKSPTFENPNTPIHSSGVVSQQSLRSVWRVKSLPSPGLANEKPVSETAGLQRTLSTASTVSLKDSEDSFNYSNTPPLTPLNKEFSQSEKQYMFRNRTKSQSSPYEEIDRKDLPSVKNLKGLFDNKKSLDSDNHNSNLVSQKSTPKSPVKVSEIRNITPSSKQKEEKELKNNTQLPTPPSQEKQEYKEEKSQKGSRVIDKRDEQLLSEPPKLPSVKKLRTIYDQKDVSHENNQGASPVLKSSYSLNISKNSTKSSSNSSSSSSSSENEEKNNKRKKIRKKNKKGEINKETSKTEKNINSENLVYTPKINYNSDDNNNNKMIQMDSPDISVTYQSETPKMPSVKNLKGIFDQSIETPEKSYSKKVQTKYDSFANLSIEIEETNSSAKLDNKTETAVQKTPKQVMNEALKKIGLESSKSIDKASPEVTVQTPVKTLKQHFQQEVTAPVSLDTSSTTIIKQYETKNLSLINESNRYITNTTAIDKSHAKKSNKDLDSSSSDDDTSKSNANIGKYRVESSTSMVTKSHSTEIVLSSTPVKIQKEVMHSSTPVKTLALHWESKVISSKTKSLPDLSKISTNSKTITHQKVLKYNKPYLIEKTIIKTGSSSSSSSSSDSSDDDGDEPLKKHNTKYNSISNENLHSPTLHRTVSVSLESYAEVTPVSVKKLKLKYESNREMSKSLPSLGCLSPPSPHRFTPPKLVRSYSKDSTCSESSMDNKVFANSPRVSNLKTQFETNDVSQKIHPVKKHFEPVDISPIPNSVKQQFEAGAVSPAPLSVKEWPDTPLPKALRSNKVFTFEKTPQRMPNSDFKDDIPKSIASATILKYENASISPVKKQLSSSLSSSSSSSDSDDFDHNYGRNNSKPKSQEVEKGYQENKTIKFIEKIEDIENIKNSQEEKTNGIMVESQNKNYMERYNTEKGNTELINQIDEERNLKIEEYWKNVKKERDEEIEKIKQSKEGTNIINEIRKFEEENQHKIEEERILKEQERERERKVFEVERERERKRLEEEKERERLDKEKEKEDKRHAIEEELKQAKKLREEQHKREIEEMKQEQLNKSKEKLDTYIRKSQSDSDSSSSSSSEDEKSNDSNQNISQKNDSNIIENSTNGLVATQINISSPSSQSTCRPLNADELQFFNNESSGSFIRTQSMRNKPSSAQIIKTKRSASFGGSDRIELKNNKQKISLDFSSPKELRKNIVTKSIPSNCRPLLAEELKYFSGEERGTLTRTQSLRENKDSSIHWKSKRSNTITDVNYNLDTYSKIEKQPRKITDTSNSSSSESDNSKNLGKIETETSNGYKELNDKSNTQIEDEEILRNTNNENEIINDDIHKAKIILLENDVKEIQEDNSKSLDFHQPKDCVLVKIDSPKSEPISLNAIQISESVSFPMEDLLISDTNKDIPILERSSSLLQPPKSPVDTSEFDYPHNKDKSINSFDTYTQKVEIDVTQSIENINSYSKSSESSSSESGNNNGASRSKSINVNHKNNSFKSDTQKVVLDITQNITSINSYSKSGELSSSESDNNQGTGKSSNIVDHKNNSFDLDEQKVDIDTTQNYRNVDFTKGSEMLYSEGFNDKNDSNSESITNDKRKLFAIDSQKNNVDITHHISNSASDHKSSGSSSTESDSDREACKSKSINDNKTKYNLIDANEHTITEVMQELQQKSNGMKSKIHQSDKPITTENKDNVAESEILSHQTPSRKNSKKHVHFDSEEHVIPIISNSDDSISQDFDNIDLNPIEYSQILSEDQLQTNVLDSIPSGINLDLKHYEESLAQIKSLQSNDIKDSSSIYIQDINEKRDQVDYLAEITQSSNKVSSEDSSSSDDNRSKSYIKDVSSGVLNVGLTAESQDGLSFVSESINIGNQERSIDFDNQEQNNFCMTINPKHINIMHDGDCGSEGRNTDANDEIKEANINEIKRDLITEGTKHINQKSFGGSSSSESEDSNSKHSLNDKMQGMNDKVSITDSKYKSTTTDSISSNSDSSVISHEEMKNNKINNEFKIPVNLEVLHPQINTNQIDDVDGKKKHHKKNYDDNVPLNLEVLHPQINIIPNNNKDLSFRSHMLHQSHKTHIAEEKEIPISEINLSDNVRNELKRESSNSDDSSSSSSINSVILNNVDTKLPNKADFQSKSYHSHDSNSYESDITVLKNNSELLTSSINSNQKLENYIIQHTNLQTQNNDTHKETDFLMDLETQIKSNATNQTNSQNLNKANLVDESLLNSSKVQNNIHESLQDTNLNRGAHQLSQDNENKKECAIDKSLKLETSLTRKENEHEQNLSGQIISQNIPQNLEVADNTHSVGPFHGLLITSEIEFLWLCFLVTIISCFIYYWKNIFD